MPRERAAPRESRSMKVCSQCGATCSGDDNFCKECGGALKTADLASQPQGRSKLLAPLMLLLGVVFLGVGAALAVKLYPLLRTRSPLTGNPGTATPTTSASPVDYTNPWPSNEQPAGLSNSPAPETTPEEAPTTESSPDPEETPESPDMEAQLAEYYRLIDGKMLTAAYALRSRRSRNQTSQAEFEKIWSNNRSLSLTDFHVLSQDSDRALVRIHLVADDIDLKSGKSTVATYVGKITLVLEDGHWCYDGGDFQVEKSP